MINISVIVPVYNVEKYLVGCIESILHQTFKGTYEVILVDDGSTDGSGEICDHYSEQCKVIHQPNRGVSAARNVGMRAAQGEYLSFVDSDDTLREYALEKLWQRVIEHTNVDVVVGQIETPSGVIPFVRREVSYSNDITFIRNTNVWRVLGYSAYSKLIRRDVVVSYNIFFNEELGCNEDLLWLFFLRKHVNSIAWCYEAVCCYNQNNTESITHGPNKVRNHIYRLKSVEIMAANMQEDWQRVDNCMLAEILSIVVFADVWKHGEHKRLRQAACHTYKELRRCHVGFYLCYKAWLLTVPIPPKVTFWLSRPFTRLLRVFFE